MLRTALLGVLLFGASPQDDYPFGRTPDGRPGLGASPDARDVARLFRSPREGEERRWLRDLFALPGDVEVFLSVARARYERAGFFDVLPDPSLARAGAGLADLHRSFALLEASPFVTARTPAAARALGGMLLDDRFRVRRPLLDAAAEEARELRGALALLEGHARGLAQIEEPELLSALAARTDLAASRLRALRLDLELLYEPASDVEPPGVPGDLFRALRFGDPQRGAPLLKELDAQGARRRERLRSSLFTSRFDRRAAELLQERTRGRAVAYDRLRQVMRLLPFVAGEEPLEGADLKNVERYRRAAEVAAEAVLHDPLLDGAHYMLGVATDFFAGRGTSRAHFDRYLALRGIRHWEHGTFAHRDLIAAERFALLVVADWRPPAASVKGE